MNVKATISFTGAISMRQGEERELSDSSPVLKDLLGANYVVGMDLARGNNKTGMMPRVEENPKQYNFLGVTSDPQEGVTSDPQEGVTSDPQEGVTSDPQEGVMNDPKMGEATEILGGEQMAANVAYVQTLAEKLIKPKLEKAKKPSKKKEAEKEAEHEAERSDAGDSGTVRENG